MIDTQLAALLGPPRPEGAPDLCDLPVEIARAVYRQLMSASGGPARPVEIRNLDMPGEGPLRRTRLRSYAPPRATGLPVVVWFHGGGYMLGDLDCYDGVCGQICLDAQAVVVAVDYRLAPEDPFPAAFEDAWSSLRWLASPAGADALGPMADIRRLALAGDSAGAVLALSTALKARDTGGPPLAALALAYPPAAALGERRFASHEQHAHGPTLTLRTMAHFNRVLLEGAKAAPDHRLSPLDAPSLAGLPPTLLQLAALDPLRDEGAALAERMNAEGTGVTLVEYHGLAHGYLGHGGRVAAARRALRQLGDCLGEALWAGQGSA